MNYIKYGDYKFHGNSSRWGTDGLFMSGACEQLVALFGNELAADSLTFVVNSEALQQGSETEPTYVYLLDVNEKPIKTSDGKFLVARHWYPDYREFTAGAVLDLYNNPGGTIIGRFYVEEVKQISRKTVQFRCTDGIGMLSKMTDHKGGLYLQALTTTAGTVINEIFAGSGLSYTVNSEVANLQLIGHLPRANRRENLARILTATGASCTEKNGRLVIENLYYGGSQTTPASRVYLSGGSVSYLSPATRVEVVEHNFYALDTDQEETLFDNAEDAATAYNQLVIFDEPCRDLTVSGSLTINESNVNYAIVSGTGTLTGKPYTHTRRVMARDTGVNAAEYVVRIEDNELVSSYNSQNLLRRMANYYKCTLSIQYEQIDPTGTILPGTSLDVVDPFGVRRSGFISRKSFPIGNKTKAQMDVLVDFVSGPFGGSYDRSTVFDASNISNGRLTFPAAMVGKQALVVLFGGAGGGQAGYDGTDGQAPKTRRDYESRTLARGGTGGEGGAIGERGNILTFTVDALPAYYTGAAIGTGGEGGTENGELGQPGTATTLGGYSSDDGVQLLSVYQDFITGTFYAEETQAGEEGGWGGAAFENGPPDRAGSYGNMGGLVIVRDGQQITELYIGGLGVAGNYYRYSRWNVYNGAAGGGGAAYGQKGDDGSTQTEEGATLEKTQWSRGGNGADAVAESRVPAPTCTGYGGHGGGGGGGAFLCEAHNRNTGSVGYGYNTAGKGGKGGAGGKGGDGLILVYWHS